MSTDEKKFVAFWVSALLLSSTACAVVIHWVWTLLV